MKPLMSLAILFTAGLVHAQTTKVLATCKGSEFTPTKLYNGINARMPGTKLMKNGTCGTKVSLVDTNGQSEGSDFFSLELNNQELVQQISRNGSKTLADFFAGIQKETKGACEFLLPSQFQSILAGPTLEKYLGISSRPPPGVEIKSDISQ